MISMRLIGLFILTLFNCAFILGQNGTIKGKVVDKTNKGFPDTKIYLEGDRSINTRTNIDGEFSLSVTPGEHIVVIKYLQEKQKVPVNIREGEVITLDKVKLDVQYFEGVSVEGVRKTTPIGDLPMIEVQQIPGPQSSVEKYITLTTAAVSNNELTNNYNVRGGSYDENLVYVNGFQIYRPFLTRTGQQEGMSFINPDLVNNISFSAGGFAAEYGDRLSSVLDIKYRTPKRFRGSFNASLLGTSIHVEDKVNARFNYMVAGRYQDQSYVLDALPVQGAYRPRFYDFQLLTNYSLTENLTWSVLGHFSSNDYRFAPESQETRFGTVNQALSFRVFFEGEELTRFQTITGATSLKWDVNKRTNLELYAKIFSTDENETFDILGQYFINEIETDPAQEEFGDSVGTLGVGSFLDHARNRLQAMIYSVRHVGEYNFLKVTEDGLDYKQRGVLRWGVSAQYEKFNDVLSEWNYVDSAGFSLPQSPAGSIELFEVIKAQNTLETFRTQGFAQFSRSFNTTKENYPVEITKKHKDSLGNKISNVYRDTVDRSRAQLSFNAGVRGGYTAFNNEFYITPRAIVNYFPRKYYLNEDGILKKRFIRIHSSAGFYYQPPFYRELRRFDGTVATNTLSQKSFHFVSGMDYAFEMWDRQTPFKLTGEVFYKYMWDINPYEIDNVRTRYYGENSAIGHSFGMDMNLHGEFIEGTQSFFKLGLLRVIEDLNNDDYYTYINTEGENIIPGFTFNDTIADSTLNQPGFIPKPTDQWFTFATLFQDRMPTVEQFTVQLGFNFGSRLPYGPPDRNRYKDTLRQKAYFRVDIGFGYDFLYKRQKKEDRKKFLRPFTDVRLNFEIFNLLGINNVLSQQWVQDTQGRFFAIPNYLTQRRFNLKLILRW